jgi:tRNA threonylcarbamoyladenosine biosynthesis protein TsaB
MKILAIDTATERCSVALLNGEAILIREVMSARTHAEQILPLIDAVLQEAGLSLSQLDRLACGCGPGAFTSVRLAISVVQGLAFAADRPVVAVSDLAAVAYAVLHQDPVRQTVLVCNDARMQEVYWARYSRDARLGVQLDGIEQVSPAAQVLSQLDAQRFDIGAGLGFALYPELASKVGQLEETILPHARDIALLAQHVPALPLQQLTPVYLRNQVT